MNHTSNVNKVREILIQLEEEAEKELNNITFYAQAILMTYEMKYASSTSNMTQREYDQNFKKETKNVCDQQLMAIERFNKINAKIEELKSRL